MSKGYHGCDHCPELTRSKKCGLENSLAVNLGFFLIGIYPGEGFVSIMIRGIRKKNVWDRSVIKS